MYILVTTANFERASQRLRRALSKSAERKKSPETNERKKSTERETSNEWPEPDKEPYFLRTNLSFARFSRLKDGSAQNRKKDNIDDCIQIQNCEEDE